MSGRSNAMVVRSKEELRRMLQEEQAYLNQRLEQMSKASVAAHESIGYGNHMADDATEAFEQSKGLSLQQTIQNRLTQVNYALRKFNEGVYGVCEQCGQTIDWARLEALPAARLCIRCQELSEWTA
jgi:DnaK suppressor protein